jgi:hypothetical protein
VLRGKRFRQEFEHDAFGRQREVADWDMWDTDAVDVDQADGVN